MAEIFIEGFDKYGPPANLAANLSDYSIAAMTAGEWTSLDTLYTNSYAGIVAGLSSPGNAFCIKDNSGVTLTKTLAANYSRLILGFRFKSDLVSQAAVLFTDTSTAQCCLTLETTGQINFRHGGVSGSVIALAASVVTANTIHYLEIDVTFGASSAYTLWLDGASVGSGSTGNTITTAHTFANGVQFTNGSSSGNLTLDDIYLFDSTGSHCNAALNTNPVVETCFAVADNSVQFSPVATTLGYNYNNLNMASTCYADIGANTIYLQPVTPLANMTLHSVSALSHDTDSGALFEAVVYSATGTRLGTGAGVGSAVSGVTALTAFTSTFSTGIALTGGTTYYIGFISNHNVGLFSPDSSTFGQTAANTYSSGAPSTLPTMTTAQPTLMIWANCDTLAANFPALNVLPPIGLGSCVASSTAGNTDLYDFNALTATPTSIYTVAVKAFMNKSDAGFRSADLLLKSSGVVATGSLAGQALSSSFVWQSSFFTQDPNTGSSWTATGLNAALGGFRIAS